MTQCFKIICFLPLSDYSRDEHIDVVTESNEATKSSERRSDVSSSKTQETEVSTCRLSPELPRGPAYIAGEHAHVDLDSGKPKIWSVTDFLSSASQNPKDSLGFAFPKLDSLKSISDGSSSGMGIDTRPMMGRPSVSHGLAAVSTPSHHVSAYQSSLGYGPGAYPYSLSPYGGGKLLRPSVSPASRFNPFPSVRPLAVDSPYVPRRDVALAREGE